MTDIESLSASLVREYLSRKGLKRSLRVLDDEFPRREDSVRNRVILAKELKIEKLIRLNKEEDNPFRTMVEVMVKYFVKENDTKINSHQRGSKDDGTDKSTRKKSSLTHSHKGAPSDPSFDLDYQLDAALRISKGQIDGQGKMISDKANQKRDSQSKESSSIPIRTAKSLSSLGQNEDIPVSRSLKSKGSLKPLSDSNSSNKLKSQGRIQKTIEKSRKPKSKKTLDININGFGAENFGDDDVEKMDEYKWQTGSSQKSRQGASYNKEDIANMGRKSSKDFQSEEKLQSQKIPRTKEKQLKASSDLLLYDDIEDELSEDLEDAKLGPIKKMMSKLYESSSVINMETAIDLKKIVFGSSSTSFNPEWRNQSFSFCDLPDLGYGIVQIKGGPCGILAAVQATLLKHLLFAKDSKSQFKRPPDPSSRERTDALIESATEILWRAGARKTASVVIPSGKAKFVGGGRYKSDGLTETITIYDFNERENLQAFISQNIGQFESESSSGCILLLYSLVFSRTIKRIKSDMDEPNGTFLGSHGYCTQELVNLCLTGKAVSNVFDGIMELDSGGSAMSVLKGIEKQSDVGFLSLFEHYESCKVGDNYKNPAYPIWVVCSESHFSVLFCTNGRLLHDKKYQKKFDLYYYDGLARQDEEIRLSVDTQGIFLADKDDLVPPLEHCIRTKWKNATVDWNDTEPIL